MFISDRSSVAQCRLGPAIRTVFWGTVSVAWNERAGQLAMLLQSERCEFNPRMGHDNFSPSLWVIRVCLCQSIKINTISKCLPTPRCSSLWHNGDRLWITCICLRSLSCLPGQWIWYVLIGFSGKKILLHMLPGDVTIEQMSGVTPTWPACTVRWDLDYFTVSLQSRDARQIAQYQPGLGG